jgi:multicomponent Na+:H+ antiporter subunit D
MRLLLLLPVVIPFLTAILALLFNQRRAAQRALGVIGSVGLLVAGIMLLAVVWTRGIQVTQLGGWPAPYGITFVADLFSAIMVLLAGIMGLTVTVYSLVTIDAEREKYGYYPLVQILLMGVCGAFLTGDIFNLYVWFEVLLIASFVLLALGSERAQMEGAIKYVTLNLISSAFFLAAIGLLYAEAGTLNMADLSRKLLELPQQGLVTTVATLFLIAFGIKAAMFPLFFWLPASYHTPPTAVAAIFAGLLTKVGVYALVRTFTLIFVNNVAYTHTIILTAAGLTMIVGVLGALAQTEIRRILSFLIVSHIGFAVMGLGIYTPPGIAGSIFYVIEDMIVLTALFLVSGVIRVLGGSDRLDQLGGLYASAPGVAALFFIPALSLAGVPPLSGFFAKLALLEAGIAAQQYAIVVTAIIASVLTLLTIVRFWSEVFWKPAPLAAGALGNGQGILLMHGRDALFLWTPIVVMVALIVAIGLAAGPVFGLAQAAGQQLFDPVEYMRVVLGGLS